MISNTKENIFKISLSLLSHLGPKKDFDIMTKHRNFWNKEFDNEILIPREILYGFEISDNKELNLKRKESAKLYLSEAYGIHTEKSYSLVINNYLNCKEKRDSFNNMRQTIINLPTFERAKFMDSLDKKSVEYFQYSMIIQYDKSIPNSGILAYDIGNFTSLCRIGAYLGYLSPESFLSLVTGSANLAKKSYRSFEEFGLCCVLGYLYSNGYNDYESRLRNFRYCLTDKYSYWRYISWNEISVN